MKYSLLAFFGFLPCIYSIAQVSDKAEGDFNGDGKKETATFITVRERYFEGGYDPVSIPGEYAIEFSDKNIPRINLGGIAGGLLTKKDFNKNGKEELMFIGSDTEVPVEGSHFRVYEYHERNMQGILSGPMPSGILRRKCEDSLLLTLNDTVYLLSQPLLNQFVLHAQKVFPELDAEKIEITRQHKLFPYVKNFVDDSILQKNIIYNTYDIDTIPEYTGGETALKKFVDANLHYSELAKEMNLEGRIHIEFIVNKDGTLSDFKVTNKAEEILWREVIRVYKRMPPWQPGMKQGNPVRTRMTASYEFKLN